MWDINLMTFVAFVAGIIVGSLKKKKTFYLKCRGRNKHGNDVLLYSPVDIVVRVKKDENDLGLETILQRCPHMSIAGECCLSWRSGIMCKYSMRVGTD